jgi:hypothetical protein
MSRTITGCVSWGTGEVVFDAIDCATISYGCIEWTGDHAGMVKAVIDDAEMCECNDTFYGCVNWTTGRFQIEIPDDCCLEECAYCDENDCGDRQSPKYITVSVTGTDMCFIQTGICYKWYFSDYDGTYYLTRDAADACLWLADISLLPIRHEVHNYSSGQCLCDNLYSSQTCYVNRVRVTRGSGAVSLNFDLIDQPTLCGYAEGAADYDISTTCIVGSYSDSYPPFAWDITETA